MTEVFIDGVFAGNCEDSRDFCRRIIKSRRKGKIPESVNVSYSEKRNQIDINTISGRLRRPLIVVKNGKPLLDDLLLEKVAAGKVSWNDLVDDGIIEYLDAQEEENAYIAVKPEELKKEHTHLEVSPAAILGALANMVPFPEYNQSPRVMTGAKMMRQTLGIYSKNFVQRMDTDVSILHYPQTPITKTFMYDYTDFESRPAGQNVVVAVMSYDGYNMEDAIVINQSSIERGLFRSTYYRPYSAEELRYPGGQKDKITIPEKDVSGYKMEEDYKYLEGDGIVYPSASVEGGDVVIGKISPPRFLSSLDDFRLGVQERNETSETVRFGEEGVVEDVLVTDTQEGNKYVKVKLRDKRIPEIGDKFSSRHGQKGVVGLAIPQEDMPFTANGIVPDIIFNPHGLPSRMTIGHIIEIIAGKVGSLAGRQVDASAFMGENEFDLREELLSLGFREDGLETMYNGKTGEEFQARIFVGNMYYLKLKYMVANKIHARSRGPVQLLTRQPTEGRSKEGGLRLGEMEKDCFVAHGASLALKERFDSDKTIVPICKECGSVAVYNKYKKQGFCPNCGEESPIGFVEMSYAFKLLINELKTMSIYPKLIVEPKA